MELKEIDNLISSTVSLSKEELCHVTCKGEDCNKIFVTKEGFDKWTDDNYTQVIPIARNVVRACFDVLNCQYAFCNECYLKLVLNSEGEGNDRSSRRRRI